MSTDGLPRWTIDAGEVKFCQNQVYGWSRPNRTDSFLVARLSPSRCLVHGYVRFSFSALMPPRTAHKTGCISLNAAFCRLIFLQLPSSQRDMAEACGSRIQTLDSQRTANDDVAASA